MLAYILLKSLLQTFLDTTFSCYEPLYHYNKSAEHEQAATLNMFAKMLTSKIKVRRSEGDNNSSHIVNFF